MLPLPVGLLHTLSPARAALADALAPVMPALTKAPISLYPPMGVVWLFSLLCYIATFFLVRELGWRFVERPWVPVVPLIIIATLEAIVGLVQVSAGWPNTEATGTYTNRDHFSGMLEMVLPIAAICGWSILQRRRHHFESSIGPVFQICLVWSAAVFILVAILYSLSRMGFFVAIVTLCLVAALSVGPRIPSENMRLLAVTAAALGLLALFIFLPPDQLLARMADLSASGKLSTDTRIYLWKETLSVINEFRWFGCGLGGFEPAFLKYQGTANGFRVEMAHNDYLQYLAELGIIGFAILSTAIAGVLLPVLRGMLRPDNEDRRLLLVACFGSVAAIALHSIVDFNLYIPANAMTLAWIAGVASVNGLE
jgi:O-antigen ligase